MRFLNDKARRLSIGWNERRLGEAEFFRLCRALKVKVTEMPLTSGGFYYRVKDRDFIAIDSRMSGVTRLLVLWHELAHFLFHTPESGATANFHNVGRKTRVEREADAFALCAVIPMNWLETLTPDEIIANEGVSPAALAERVAIYTNHGY